MAGSLPQAGRFDKSKMSLCCYGRSGERDGCQGVPSLVWFGVWFCSFAGQLWWLRAWLVRAGPAAFGELSAGSLGDDLVPSARKGDEVVRNDKLYQCRCQF